VVRLGFLAVLPRKSIPGIIGSIAPERHRRLLLKLGNYLTKESQPIE
jgi:mRNA interferase MazF